MQPHSAALARSKSTWQRPTTLPDLRQAGLIALDSETKDLGLQAGLSPGSSTNNGCVVGISVAHRAGTETPGYYFPIAHPDSDNFPREQVAQWLRDHLKAGVRIVGCNLLYDLGWLSTDLGIPVPSAEQLEEVTAAATFTNENLFTYSLDALCQAYDVPGKDETLLREAITLQLGVKPGIRTNPPQAYIAQLPAQFVGPYAEQDAISTLRLHETLQPILQREGTHKAYRTDVGLIPMVLAMQRRGIRIDVAAAERNRDLLLQKRNTIFAELSDKLGQPVSMEEIGRSKWLAEICDQRGVSYPRTAKGAPSFRRGPNGGWMHRCEDPIIRLIVTADVYNNAATNFIEHHILEHVVNGRLHPEIHPFRSEDSGTKSFRFSYSNPPLQQMPSHDPEIMQAIRSLFLPEDGEFWVSLDYAQQEFRLLTDAAARYGLTGALEAVARYKTDPTTDFHAMVAGMLGLSRPDAKTINFGIIYGMGVHKLAVSLGRTEDEAQAILERYHRELPFPHLLSDLMRLQVNRQGYLELCDGARRHYDLWHAPFAPQAEGAGPCDAEEARRRRNDSSHPWYGQMLRRVGSNAALNALIQGNAARQTKLWMLAVYRELGIVPLLQMHDALECSLSAPKQAERIAELGRDLIPLMLPMRIDSKVGRSWGGAKYSWDMAAEISPVVVESTVRLTPPLAERTDTGWSPAVALPVTSLDIATCTLDAELPLARCFAWIMAREKIRLRKESGASWPWTDNLIMQGIFCNAYREHDRVSRWVFDHILTPNRDDPDLWFAVATARLINEPDAVAAIGELVPFDPGRIQAALEARQARKERVLRSSAYRLPTPPTKGDSTIRFVVNDVLKPMWDNRETLRPRADDTLASFSARLEQCHQIGPFLAAQIIADVKRVQLLDASDRDSYVREGPGSGPGLNRMLGRTVTAAWSQGRFSATVLAVRSLFAPLLEAACLKLMDAQDIQHICCEFNKFEKAREAGKPLRRYKGAAVVAAKLPKPRKTKPATKQAPVTPTPAAAPDLSHLPAFMRGDVNLPSTAVLLAVTPSPPATAQTVEAPDLEEAARFLKLLDPAATQFTFQTFDDNKERKDPALVKMLHGTLAHCESRLTSLNAAGAGVFVTINETDLRGRKNKNITHVRRLFIDCDGAPLPQDEPRWQFAVESSKGHYHAYWRIDELALDAFTPAQELIIKRFGGDPVVKDLPRVMRLPGFWHLKDKPFRSRILEIRDDSPIVQPADFETAEHKLQIEEISTHISSEPMAPLSLIAAVLRAIPNQDLGDAAKDNWDRFNTIGMALYRATGGSDEGFALFLEFLQRWPKYDAKRDDDYARKRWYQNFRRSPPTEVGFGKLNFLATEANPNWQIEYEEAERRKAYAETEPSKPKTNGAGMRPSEPLQEPSSPSDESWPQLDPDAMYGLVGDVVRAIAPHTESDPNALLLQYLASFGNAVGRRPYYFIEAAQHYANIFILLAGPTAKGRKGTAAQHVRRIFEIADPGWTGTNIVGGISSGEGIIHAIRDPIIVVKKGVEEVTDPGIADKRMLLDERESSTIFDNARREGNIASRILREAWDDPVILRTLTKHSPTKVTQPYISVIGHITIDELRRKLDEACANNGLGNRFLFACVTRSRELPHGGNLDPNIINQLGSATYTALAAARVLERVTMTASAHDWWGNELYHRLTQPRPGLYGALTARSEPQTLRLALIYTLVDHKQQIDLPHLKAAAALWDFCEASAKHIFGDLLGDRVADAILMALRRTGAQGMRRSEINDLFSRHNHAAIARALEVLLSYGKVKRAKILDGFGRPAEMWWAV